MRNDPVDQNLKLQSVLKQIDSARRDTSVTSFDLYNTLPYKVGAERLSKVMSAFEGAGITSLSLSGNFLCNLGAEGLSKVILALKNTGITSLNLSYNNLNVLGIVEAKGWPKVMLALKDTSVTSLDLGHNTLGLFGTAVLLKVISALKVTGVTSLNLSANCLDSLEVEELSKVISALKVTGVTSLNLSANCLDSLEAEELSKVISALKDTSVTSLDLSNNFSGGFETKKYKYVEIFRHLPIPFEKMIVDNKIFSFPDFYLANIEYPECESKFAEHFIHSIKQHMQKFEDAYFEAMSFPFINNKIIFDHLVHGLKGQQTGIASFACGVLLTTVAMSLSSLLYDNEDLEKSVFTGIDFLLSEEVQNTPNLKQKANFILWHIRTVNADQSEFFMPLVANRLEKVAITAPDFFAKSYAALNTSNIFSTNCKHNNSVPLDYREGKQEVSYF